MRRLVLTLVLMLIAVTAFSPAAVDGQPRRSAGSYNIVVGGNFRGKGSAVLAGRNLRIDGNVTDDKGANGELNFNARIGKDHHFSATGNVIGRQAVFTGRIDVPDDMKERAIKGVRITCMFKTADEQYGRFIAWLPNNAQMPIDEDRGRGGHRD